MRIKEKNEQRMVLQGHFRKKIVLDRVRQNIEIDSLFAHRGIPFLEVTRVLLSYHIGWGDYGKVNWRVAIVRGGELLKIGESDDRREMYELGRQTSNFIGVKFIDIRPIGSVHPNARFDVSPRDRYGRGR